MFILYNRATRARTIARELRVPRFYPYEGRTRGPRRPRTMRHLINWGCARYDFDPSLPVLNRDVRTATSKVATYQALYARGLPVPIWTLDPQEAKAWGVGYLGRRDGLSCGRGITIYDAGSPPQRQHDFFTQVIPCRREYRIHVGGGNVLAIQKKRIANATSIIHNHVNGVLFQHIPEDTFNIGERTTREIKQLAIDAVAGVGLDFGAVDIIQEADTNRLFVLEVNSAPAIQTEPIYAAYMGYFRQFVGEVHRGD